MTVVKVLTICDDGHDGHNSGAKRRNVIIFKYKDDAD